MRTARKMIKHYHEDKGDETIWHDGSLADCPETKWADVLTCDGKPARLAYGMSVSLPPNHTSRVRRRFRDDEPIRW